MNNSKRLTIFSAAFAILAAPMLDLLLRLGPRRIKGIFQIASAAALCGK
jgi:hypothetical protein